MTQVVFYHDADNKIAVAARLAQKGVAAGKRLLLLVADAETAAQADRSLWTFAPYSFVAHACADSPLAAESPVLIAPQRDFPRLQKNNANATLRFHILINLDTAMPEGIADFERVIEIVTHDDNDKAAARERFKAYRALGCELNAHRLGQHE